MATPGDIDVGAPQSELASAHNGQRTDRERCCVRKGGSRFWGISALVAMREERVRLISERLPGGQADDLIPGLASVDQ